MISFAEYFSVREYFVWKIIERLWLVCNISQDDAKSILIKLVSYLGGIPNVHSKLLRGNISDIEVFDVVLSQHFSGLNLLDILVLLLLVIKIFRHCGSLHPNILLSNIIHIERQRTC